MWAGGLFKHNALIFSVNSEGSSSALTPTIHSSLSKGDSI
jgi:hypothetical protein